jgi:hypothetical protein
MAAESRVKKAAASEDGSATERTYMRAVELMRGGHSGKAAFEQIAAETGESAGTVQARYYRVARKAGEVQRRPRSKTPAAKAATAPPKARAARGSRRSSRATAPTVSANSLASKLDAAARLLQEAASEIRSLEGDAEKWRQIRPLLDAR